MLITLPDNFAAHWSPFSREASPSLLLAIEGFGGAVAKKERDLRPKIINFKRIDREKGPAYRDAIIPYVKNILEFREACKEQITQLVGRATNPFEVMTLLVATVPL